MTTTKLVFRKAHFRRLNSGKQTQVRETWVTHEANGAGAKSRSFKHSCPSCGCNVISVHMPNGGWAHFEAAKGLRRIKHPCLHRGEDYSRCRDDKTLDLFDIIKGEEEYLPNGPVHYVDVISCKVPVQ